ncbi:hypothetical protein ASF96_00805 [Microbacterium sp. Leaf179]|nr:hypothetical protein ASF96_00805 [Microbacterium sp. Leaf179]
MLRPYEDGEIVPAARHALFDGGASPHSMHQVLTLATSQAGQQCVKGSWRLPDDATVEHHAFKRVIGSRPPSQGEQHVRLAMNDVNVTVPWIRSHEARQVDLSPAG